MRTIDLALLVLAQVWALAFHAMALFWARRGLVRLLDANRDRIADNPSPLERLAMWSPGVVKLNPESLGALKIAVMTSPIAGLMGAMGGLVARLDLEGVFVMFVVASILGSYLTMGLLLRWRSRDAK